jgi:hypothetical protein
MISFNRPDPKTDVLNDYAWTPVVDGADSLFRRDSQDHFPTHTSTTITWRGHQTGPLNRSISPAGSTVAIARAILAEHDQMETEDVILLLHNLDISENDALDAMQYLVLTGMAGVRDYSVLFRIEAESVIEVHPRRQHWLIRVFGSLFSR